MLSVYHTCIIVLESLIRNIYEKITAFVAQFWIVQRVTKVQCFDCLQCFDAVGWAAGRASGL